MRVIPVIDILNNVVVHAKRGRRDQYKILKSKICSSAQPFDVAHTFKTWGFKELYVADLDAILGKIENLSTLQRISKETRLKLLVDAGIFDENKCKNLVEQGVSKVVIGTETLPSLLFVKEAIKRLGASKIVVSLDMKGGRLLSISENIRIQSEKVIAYELQNLGVEEIIVLDLKRVGSGEGVDFSLLEKIVSDTKLRVIVGGGVHNVSDLVRLRELGADGALIATALHTKKITQPALKKEGFL